MTDKRIISTIISKNRRETVYAIQYTMLGMQELIEKQQQAKQDYIADKVQSMILNLSLSR